MLAIAACTHPPAERVIAKPGRTVSIYMPSVAIDPALAAALVTIRERIGDDEEAVAPDDTTAGALGYVDDRRWIELAAGGDLAFDDLPATADLDSLIVEPLGERGLTIVQCTRAPALATALSDLAGAHGLVGRSVVARLADGGTAKGTVRSVDDTGLWLDDAGRAIRVDAKRVTSLRVAGPGAGGATGVVRCKVHGAPGRHLVRVAYATTGVAWRAVHRIEVAMAASGEGGTATVRTGFEIIAPGWSGDAEIALWRGVPGTGEPPERVWSGSSGLGGDVTVWGEPREVAAHLITVYRGAMVSGVESTGDAYWRQQSVGEVRTWLVVDARLAPGAAVVAIKTSADLPARVAQAPAERDGDTTRVPLWVDATLRGFRVKVYQSGDEHVLREHLGLSVANLSDRPRDVWIEEELRPARHRKVLHARPAMEIKDGWLRVKLAVPAGGVAKAACDLAYDL